MTRNGTSNTDTLTGGDDNDTMHGWAGADFLEGGHGMDKLYGEVGNDVSIGGTGDDMVAGGFGDDAMFGDYQPYGGGYMTENGTMTTGVPGADRLYGGDGNDYMDGGGADDMLDGGIGSDQMWGSGGADGLYGSWGHDKLFGGSRASFGDGMKSPPNQRDQGDTLDGGEGNDELDGSGGEDVLLGGGGTDILIGGLGADVLTGGSGADTFVFGIASGYVVDSTAAAADTVTDFRRGTDTLDISRYGNNPAGGERIPVVFLGTGDFSASEAPSARYSQVDGNTLVEVDIGRPGAMSDGVADATITLSGTYALLATDFLL